jgi:superfamily II DNA/RNA helicase
MRFACGPPSSVHSPPADPLARAPFAQLGARRCTVVVLAAMGIQTPTAPQTRASPPWLAGHDMWYSAHHVARERMTHILWWP